VIVRLENSWARVLSGTRDEYRWLSNYLSFTETRWPGRQPETVTDSMLHPVSDVMPAGLAILARSAAVRAGVALTIQDDRDAPSAAPEPAADVSWLRDYQLDAALAFVRAGGRGIVKAPTASGKTEILVGLTRLLPVEWLMCVHRTDLVAQAAERYFLRTGERAGTFERGEWKRGTCNLTVSTFQSIARSMKTVESGGSRGVTNHAFGLGALLHGIEGLAVDECHAVPADQFYGVTQELGRARYRLGLSGTPLDRGDRESLRAVGALGPLVYSIPAKLLIDRGLLSRATVRMVRVVQQSWLDDWRRVYSELVVGSPMRNARVAEVAALEARFPCLLFVDELAQGRDVEHRLRVLGIKARFVSGKDALEARRRSVKKLVEGGTEVLICNVIFQEGIDIPELKSVVVACGKSSVVATLQRMGRGMRTCADGDDTFELWDVLDVGQKWLEQHALDRKAAYEREGYVVEVI
jgi:superfamily II DNA or RNA helicase